MKYRLQYFFEWFAMNEHTISGLHNLKPHKQLFWLHWLGWHLDFYVPGTNFMLCFYTAPQRPALFLLREKELPKSSIPTLPAFKSFDCKLFAQSSDANSAIDFQECIIPDIERGISESSLTPAVTFLNIELAKTSLFSDRRAAEVILTSRSRQIAPHLQFPMVLVQLSRQIEWQDRKMIKLIEFDHYTDFLNRTPE